MKTEDLKLNRKGKIMDKNRKITINDIAKYCGVSATTVSRVINGTSYVREGLKKKILEYINDCGWQCGSLCHKLAGKRNGVKTALVVSRRFMRDFDKKSNRIFDLCDVLREFGFEPLFTTGSRYDALQKALEIQPSLVVVYGANDRLAGPVRNLCAAGIPVISLGSGFDDAPCPSFVHDYESAAKTAVQILLKSKPEKIGMLAGISEHVHPKNLKEIPVRAVHDAAKGIAEAFPGFDLKRDLVSDCFNDYSEFKKMLHSGKYTHWVVYGTEHYLAFANALSEFSPEERKKIAVVPILENEAVSVPLYFQHALICASQIPAVRQFLKKHPSGTAKPQEIKVPFVKNGE